MRKYVVIYKSVLLENLQYAANVAMGFFRLFCIYLYFYHALGLHVPHAGGADCGLYEGTDDLVCDDDGNVVFRF